MGGGGWWVVVGGGDVWTKGTLCESEKTIIDITANQIKAGDYFSFYNKNEITFL